MRPIFQATRPAQKTTYAQKIHDDFKWAKDSADYYGSLGTLQDKFKRYKVLYNWYNNIINESDFLHITNPLATSKDKYKNFPAKLKPFNIIRSKIDQYIGEFRNRPFSYQVEAFNQDVKSRMEEEENKIIDDKLSEIFKATYQGGMQTEEEIKQAEAILQEKLNQFNHSYRDARAIMGQNSLEYIIKHKKVYQKIVEQFRDWMIAGLSLSYKSVLRDDVLYERVNPMELTYDESVQNIEDGEFAVRTTYKTISEVVDMFYDELTDKQIDDLEKGIMPGANIWFGQGAKMNNNTTLVMVQHITWKSFKLIKVKNWTDEYGINQYVILPEDYKLSDMEIAEGAVLLSYWVSEAWETTRVNNAWYFRIRPIPQQRNSIYSYSECKLPYNGRHYSRVNANNISIMELTMPYQVLYIILMYMLELTLAKDGGQIILMHKGAIPNKDGWDEEKFLYYMKALGIMFIDDKQVGANQAFNQYTSLNASTIQHAAGIVQLLEHVRNDLELMLGFTPQRMGQTAQTSTVGTTQRAISQSTLISEDLFASFEEYLKEELQGLLDCSKIAWKEGKQAIFLGSDLKRVILDIDGDEFNSSDLGVFIANTSRDIESLNMMKQSVQAFAQNGVGVKGVLDILRADSIAKLSNITEKIEQQMQAIQQQQVQGESEAKVALAERENELLKGLEAFKSELAIDQIIAKGEEDRKTKGLEYSLEPEEITETPMEEDKTPEFNHKKEVEQIKVQKDLSIAQLNAATSLHKDATDLQKEKIKSRTAIKNKTSGEK